MLWVAIVQAFVLAVLAGAGIVVAYLQWRTAHHKVIVDLFDRRFAVFQEIGDAVRPILAKGHAEGGDLIKFGQAIERARFLFGPEVRGYLDTIRDKIIATARAHDMLGNADEPGERQTLVAEKWDAFRAIATFYKDFPEICGPYMQLDQSLNDVIPARRSKSGGLDHG